jgi:hybrid cluster-associated redox disulfide protein
LLVDDVMRRWPQTVAVFIRRRMKCVGCPFGVFHTIEQACEEHSIELAEFAAALERSVEEGSSELRRVPNCDRIRPGKGDGYVT